jgi:hypothetical protein
MDHHDSLLADGIGELLQLLRRLVVPSSGNGLEDETAFLEVLGM